MALVYTLRATTSGTGAADTLTTASFTPNSISLLVVVATGLLPDGRASAPTISNTGTALTWTNRLDLVHTNGWSSTVQIWTAPVATGAAMTVTVDYNATTLEAGGGHGLVVIEFTGHDTGAAPVAQVFQDGGTAGRTGAYSGTLASAPGAGNYVITGAVADSANSGDVATGTGWTAIAADAIGDGASLIQYRTGTVSTNVAMADFSPSGAWSWAIGGVEIKVKPSTSASITYDTVDTDNTTITSGNSYTFGLPTVSAAVGQERLVVLGGIAGSDADYTACTIDGQTAIRVGSVVRGNAATTGAVGFRSFITLYRATGTANSGQSTWRQPIPAPTKLRGGLLRLLQADRCRYSFRLRVVDLQRSGDDAQPSANGVALASVVGFSGSSIAAVWSGLSENYDQIRAATDQVFTGTSASATAAQTPRAISTNLSPNLTGSDNSVAAISVSFAFATGPTAYTILALPGAQYSFRSGCRHGQRPAAWRGRHHAATRAGSHSLTGSTASGLFGRLVTAEAGSHTLTGTSVTLAGTVAPIGPVSRTYEATYADDISVTSGNTYTIPLTVSDASAANTERLVILGSITSTPGDVANGDLINVTIDGVTATRVGSLHRSPVDSNHYVPFVTAYRAPGSANTAIDVVATFTSETGGQSVSVYCNASGWRTRARCLISRPRSPSTRHCPSIRSRTAR